MDKNLVPASGISGPEYFKVKGQKRPRPAGNWCRLEFVAAKSGTKATGHGIALQ